MSDITKFGFVRPHPLLNKFTEAKPEETLAVTDLNLYFVNLLKTTAPKLLESSIKSYASTIAVQYRTVFGTAQNINYKNFETYQSQFIEQIKDVGLCKKRNIYQAICSLFPLNKEYAAELKKAGKEYEEEKKLEN